MLKLVLSAAGSTPVKIHQATTFNDALVNLLKPRLLPVWLFGWFGCAALLILALGSFSLGAMATARRYREVGIRMALGASRWRLMAS